MTNFREPGLRRAGGLVRLQFPSFQNLLAL
jgi:hypothetical protein